jgi:hypothetical protein
MSRFTGLIAILLLMTTASPTLYAQDLGYQPPASSWAERFKEAFFLGLQRVEQGIPSTSWVAQAQQKNVFEDSFSVDQGSVGTNAEKPVGNVFQLRF